MESITGMVWLVAAVFYPPTVCLMAIRATPRRIRFNVFVGVAQLKNLFLHKVHKNKWEAHAFQIMIEQRIHMTHKWFQYVFMIADSFYFLFYVLIQVSQRSETLVNYYGVAPLMIVGNLFFWLPKRFWNKRTLEVFCVVLLLARFVQGITEQNLEAWATTNSHQRLMFGFLIVRATSAITIDAVGLFMDALLMYILHGQLELYSVFRLMAKTAMNAALLFLFEQTDAIRCLNAAAADDALKGESRAQSLLSRLCEAVVTLDQHLRIAMPSPKLAGLLLQPATVDALRGKLFADLLLEDDRVLFDQFASDTAHAGESSRLQVRMRSSIGQAIKCELHHVFFTQLDCIGNEERWHVIGICELGDQTRVPTASVDLHDQPPIPEAHFHVAEPAINMEERSRDGESIAEISQQDRTDRLRAIGTADRCTSSGQSEATLSPQSSSDYDQHSCVQISWHKCNASFSDAASNRLLYLTDLAATDLSSARITGWEGTHNFMQDFTKDVLRTLKEFHREGQFPQSKLGYKLNCHVSFSTHLCVSHEMIASMEPAKSRKGLRTDPSQPESFPTLVCRNSKETLSDAHEQVVSASAWLDSLESHIPEVAGEGAGDTSSGSSMSSLKRSCKSRCENRESSTKSRGKSLQPACAYSLSL